MQPAPPEISLSSPLKVTVTAKEAHHNPHHSAYSDPEICLLIPKQRIDRLNLIPRWSAGGCHSLRPMFSPIRGISYLFMGRSACDADNPNRVGDFTPADALSFPVTSDEVVSRAVTPGPPPRSCGVCVAIETTAAMKRRGGTPFTARRVVGPVGSPARPPGDGIARPMLWPFFLLVTFLLRRGILTPSPSLGPGGSSAYAHHHSS